MPDSTLDEAHRSRQRSENGQGRPGKKPEPVTVTNTTHQPKTLMRKIFEREPEDVNGLNEELQAKVFG